MNGTPYLSIPKSHFLSKGHCSRILLHATSDKQIFCLLGSIPHGGISCADLTKLNVKLLPFLREETAPKDIGKILHISYGTIRWYLANLRKAYAVHSTRELLLMVQLPYESTTIQKMKLSPRGRQRVELFMHGMTYKQIAKQLSISRSGVRRHLEKMLWQNECKSMLELIARYKSELAQAT